MIKVVLVDDQTLVRQGVKSLFHWRNPLRWLPKPVTASTPLILIPTIKPDVVLMDMRMPIKSGLEAIQELAALKALPPTIILTTFDDDELVLAGIKAGAKGYLLKDVSLEQLVEAIEVVCQRRFTGSAGDDPTAVVGS